MSTKKNAVSKTSAQKEEKEAKEEVKLVKMVHIDTGRKADVHPDEVANYKGYRVEK